MSSGSSSSGSRRFRGPARSSASRKPGRNRPAEAASQRSSWRGSPASQRSTASSAATSCGAQARVRARGRRRPRALAVDDEPQRRGFVYVDEVGERTITVIGEKPRPKGGEGTLPWEELDETDGVYFTAGDAEAVRQARRARVLVATARELPTLHAAGVELDALVASGEDESERYQPGDLEPPPKLVVSTAGSLGGWAQPGGPYKAAAPPGPYEDAYGAGDCFAAGLTYALAKGMDVHRGARLRLGTRRARADAQGRRPHGLSATRRTSGAAGFEEARQPAALRCDRREQPLRQAGDVADDEAVGFEPPDGADEPVGEDRSVADRPGAGQRLAIARAGRTGCGRRGRAERCRTPAGSGPARACPGPDGERRADRRARGRARRGR